MRLDNITPTGARILVQKVQEEKTEGGIFVPITAEDDNTIKVKILVVGPNADPLLLGQIGIISKYSGVELAKDKGVIIVNGADVLGIVNE